MTRVEVRLRVRNALRRVQRLGKGRPHIPVRQRVHRVLRGMERFSAERPPPEGFEVCRGDEKVLGVYATPGPHPPLVVTERGLGVLTDVGWRHVPYETMTGLDVPQDKGKLEADRLLIFTKDGAAVTLPMMPEGRFNDAYSWLHFLRRVIDDRVWQFDGAGARR